MKLISYIKYITLGMMMLFAFYSCNVEDESEFPDITVVNDWKFDTNLSFTKEIGKEEFIWEKNILTLEEYWANDEVILNGNISSSIEISQFSKIDFYITAEEKEGYNFTPPFDNMGHLINSISDFSDDGDFTLVLNADDTYQLFESNFENDRSQTKVFEGDLFEIHWVITNTDGSQLDSREYVEGEYRHPIIGKYQELAPPVWEDTYDVEWLSGNEAFAIIFGINVPATGSTITITETATLGTYSIPTFFAAPELESFGLTATLVYDFNSGLSTVTDAFGFGVTWHFSNINGSSIDVEMINMDALFGPGFVYKIRLTRHDGANWPSNIHH